MDLATEPATPAPTEQTYGAVRDVGGAVWHQYAYGIWKPTTVPAGQRRIGACSLHTMKTLYGPVRWIEDNPTATATKENR